MAPTTGTSNESRRRLRPYGLHLPDMRQGRPSAPPGVVPHGSVTPRTVPHLPTASSSAGSATPAPYVRRREDALLHAPARRNQQHLHPQKLKGALWFGIDPEVHAFIKATSQGNFWGPWATLKDLPEEKTYQWWHAFIMVDEGLDEPPPYTALTRKTHWGKDGSFLDECSEELVLEVEQAVEEMLQEGSPLGDNLIESSAATNSKRFLLNQEYIKRGKITKGTIYGPGSVQYKNASPSQPVSVSLKRNLDVEMRLFGFETTISEIKEDGNSFNTEFKEAMSANKSTLDLVLKTLQSQASNPTASTSQTQSQPQGQRQGQPQVPLQSQQMPRAQGESTVEPHHIMTKKQSDLDRWIQKELGF
ncbi:unnamed protein product [Cochlearia groenlandica]